MLSDARGNTLSPHGIQAPIIPIILLYVLPFYSILLHLLLLLFRFICSTSSISIYPTSYQTLSVQDDSAQDRNKTIVIDQLGDVKIWTANNLFLVDVRNG